MAIVPDKGAAQFTLGGIVRTVAIAAAVFCGLGTWVAIIYGLRAAWSATGVSEFGSVAVWVSQLSVVGWLLALALVFGWYKMIYAILRKHATQPSTPGDA